MKSKMGTVRIVGGKWRSRRLTVPAQGVRPTLDAVKETLFNWLMPVLPGALCLDLFAGTGALGFEALSRGASHVDMVEADRGVLRQLQQQAEILGATKEELTIVHASLPEGLSRLERRHYDLVFIDPPYRQQLILPCCQKLEQSDLLADGALIYLEMEKELPELTLTEAWQLQRRKISGQVVHCLYHWRKENKLV